MRRKYLQLVVTFATTTAAMEMEQRAEKAEISGRLIPLPSEISAGCGLAWKTEPDMKEQWMEQLKLAGLSWEQMQIIDL